MVPRIGPAMDILELFQTFQTQEQAVEYLERVRWRGRPACPYCKSEKVGQHASADRKSHRWQCRDCTRAFSVTVGTLFHGTHMPLRQWFLVLALMLNSKRSASAYQISRDTGIRRATVWSMMQRIRTAMAADGDESRLLYGIVEADETYVGGKPREGSERDGDGDKPAKRGRGTKKTPVIGALKRVERVVASVAEPGDLCIKDIAKFMKPFVDRAGTLLITDEHAGYNRIGETMLHSVKKHATRYADGNILTNSIKGVWFLIKRTWCSQHHYYTSNYMALYIAEARYKHYRRRERCSFEGSIRMLVGAAL